jgi:dTDP-4-dehydrorhamnose reductase
MINAARAGKTLTIVGDQVGSPTFTHDLAAATLELVDRGAGGIWHIANAAQTNWCEFARAILAEFALEAPIQPITSQQWKQMRPTSTTRPAYSVLDIEPFERLAGRPMRPWREALRAYRDIVQSAR